MHLSHLCRGLISQSIIYHEQQSLETWSDSSPSPDSPSCVWQLWEQLLSPTLPHLCNCSQYDRAPLYLCHIPSRSCTQRHVRSTMSETAQTRTFPQMGGGKYVGLTVSPSSSRGFLIVTAVEEKTGGMSGFWDTWGLLFAGKQVCWSVTREDS